jgi:aspartokinase-like uncharacterized kinase
MTPLVLKLGGSLAETGRLRVLLALVAKARRPLVVVPGGGPFADAVREAQAELEFSDAAAHDMALLAMHQMAHMMIALEPRRLVAADTLAGMRQSLSRRQVPLWLPMKLCARDRTIPRDWSITSDGLAARLAERLCAPVALVKSCSVRPGISPEALASAGIVDPVFPAVVARAGLAWHVLGPGRDAELARLLGYAGANTAGLRLPRSTRRGIRGRAVARA